VAALPCVVRQDRVLHTGWRGGGDGDGGRGTCRSTEVRMGCCSAAHTCGQRGISLPPPLCTLCAEHGSCTCMASQRSHTAGRQSCPRAPRAAHRAGRRARAAAATAAREAGARAPRLRRVRCRQAAPATNRRRTRRVQTPPSRRTTRQSLVALEPATDREKTYSITQVRVARTKNLRNRFELSTVCHRFDGRSTCTASCRSSNNRKLERRALNHRRFYCYHVPKIIRKAPTRVTIME
jgi:hypothetical protein